MFTPRIDRPVRLLAVGDSFLPVSVFADALKPLEDQIDLTLLQLEPDVGQWPRTASDHRIDEYFGTPRQIIEALNGHEILIVHGAPVTAEVMDACPDLILIGCARGGPVNVDVEEATRRGIAVVNSPRKNAEAVAELTIALLLCLARGLVGAMHTVHVAGSIGTSTFDGARFMGRELGGQTLGVVGLGSIGSEVATRANSLGMQVLASDPFVDRTTAGQPVELVSLDDLLHRADFVSLHARATPDKRNLIGRDELHKMRATSYLLNTARPSLVDEVALLEALEVGKIAGAALDVIEHVDGTRHLLADRQDVIITPHIGGATHESLARGAQTLAAQVAQVLSGQVPSHPVNSAEIKAPAAS
jgi:D-3-phosphoglycerate dehydrogenase